MNIQTQLERAFEAGWQQGQIFDATMTEARQRYFASINPLSLTDGSKPYFCVVENPAANLSIRASWHEGETPKVEVIVDNRVRMVVYPEPFDDAPFTPDNVLEHTRILLQGHVACLDPLERLNQL